MSKSQAVPVSWLDDLHYPTAEESIGLVKLIQKTTK